MGGDSLRRLENTFRGDRILTIMTTVFGGRGVVKHTC